MRFRLVPSVAVLLAALPLTSVTAAPAALVIDPEHSSVAFSVRHLFTRVQGRFEEFSGTLSFDEENPSNSSVTVSIKAASVDTNVAARDKDLRSQRFFDVEKFPALTFKSKSVRKVSASKFKVAGTLTMHGVTRDVVLDSEFVGKGKDPWGNLRYGFRATTKLNRKDFGMQWNEVVESGGVLVGDEIEIALDVEAVPAG